MSNFDSKIILKNGEKVFLRRLSEADASIFHDFITELFASSEFVLTLPEEFQKKTVEDTKKRFSNPEVFRLVHGAFSEQHQLIGNIELSSSSLSKMKHSGIIGMGILEPYRGRGLGTALFQHLLKNADLFPQIERIELEVMKSNQAGFALYKKMGFVVEGIKRKAYKQIDGRWEDGYLMSLLRDEFPRF